MDYLITDLYDGDTSRLFRCEAQVASTGRRDCANYQHEVCPSCGRAVCCRHWDQDLQICAECVDLRFLPEGWRRFVGRDPNQRW